MAGAASLDDLATPRRWLPDDDESLAWWQALRTAAMAPWIGLVLPRVLMRLPYGAATDPVTRFAFEEMPADRPHQAYLWGGGAPALALLAGQAFQQGGWAMDLADALDLDDLPSHVYTEDGERHQQPVGRRPDERGGRPGAARTRADAAAELPQPPAARLLRWQSVAQPAQALRGLQEQG
jgi:type VI secretion system protein ImpC